MPHLTHLRVFLLACALVVISCGMARAHGTSKSYADWTVTGAEARLRVNFMGHDVAVAVAEIDQDGDRRLSAGEFEAKRALVGTRTVEGTRLEVAMANGPVEGNRQEEGMVACSARDVAVKGIGEPVEEVQVTVTYTCPTVIRALAIHSDYLPALEPPHVTVATVTAGNVTAQHIFTREARRFDLRLEVPSLGREIRDFLPQGRALFVLLALCGIAAVTSGAVILFRRR